MLITASLFLEALKGRRRSAGADPAGRTAGGPPDAADQHRPRSLAELTPHATRRIDPWHPDPPRGTGAAPPFTGRAAPVARADVRGSALASPARFGLLPLGLRRPRPDRRHPGHRSRRPGRHRARPGRPARRPARRWACPKGPRTVRPWAWLPRTRRRRERRRVRRRQPGRRAGRGARDPPDGVRQACCCPDRRRCSRTTRSHPTRRPPGPGARAPAGPRRGGDAHAS